MRRTWGSNAEALAVIAEAVKAAGYELGKDITLGDGLRSF